MRSPRVRFAFRLAISLGIADPLAWLESTPDSVVAQWMAFDEIEPIPQPWIAAATIAAEAYRTGQTMLAIKGAQTTPRSIQSFLPGHGDPMPPEVTEEQSKAWARRTAGIE